MKKMPQGISLNNGENKIHYTKKIKYLGSIIPTYLTKGNTVEERIKKANDQMGILKSFFFCKDINKIIKTGYILQDPSTPCYGEQNHGTYQEKQGQTKSLSSQVEQKNPWHQMGIHMKECRISNEHIRAWFLIIPPIDHFLTRRT